ncbi:MAG: ATP-grasp domain-containing protein [Bacteriovoracales bacterium]|nr:ATP-grasp domain-containing protein [Bacteriovoracales bacterium]
MKAVGPFRKILVANRSEIAVRIMNTCRLMDIPTVGLFAEDDRHSLHLDMARETYGLGGGELHETYLNVDKILKAAESLGADAIHPGYGLLSERADFCRACGERGIVFIGPTPEAMALMGDKRASKEAMEKLGVPLIPGYHGRDNDPKQLLKEAKRLGTPLLIKASAGGGGKGMRLVEDLSTFSEHLASAMREAQNAFGDDRVILEKFITNPRHIEVQVLSDAHGGHFHFWERECSIQRRHQKIIEETPSPALDQTLREKICEAALTICRGIDYLGAGTVEFIFDEASGGGGQFYFLEMNTRLQVEHPITEMVTGYDLVEGQIRAARGEKLNLTQEEITQRGYALEVRLYAEDPDAGFLPTTGTVRSIGESRLPGIRLECGLKEGASIGIQYDPMMAKLCTHALSREGSIEKMRHLLNDYPFLGLSTNRDYLQRILAHPHFREGKTFTHFVQTHKKDLSPPKLQNRELAAIAAAYTLSEKEPSFSQENGPQGGLRDSLFKTLGGFRNG